MLHRWQLMAVFIPALLVAGIALGVRIIQYEPLYPDISLAPAATELPAIPIFSDDPILGNKKAPVTIIAFEDFGCEACKAQLSILHQLLTAYPDKIKIVWKGLPVSRIPYPSLPAHRYAYCANREGVFTAFADGAFALAPNLAEPDIRALADTLGLDSKRMKECLASTDPDTYIQTNEDLARALQVQAVPTVFLNNKQIAHPTDLAGWKSLLELSSV